MRYVLLSLLIIGLSIIVTRVFCHLAKNTLLMDKPNERSLHVLPTVRGGGVVFIGLFILSLPVIGFINQAPYLEQLVLFMGVLAIALIGFLDDMYHLSAKIRFVVQALVAGLLAYTTAPVALNFMVFELVNPYVIAGFILFCTVGAINHFNFMDGLDGFCGAQALFLFAVYALFFYSADGLFYGQLCCVLVFGLIGFLRFNFPPAQLFMGDVGSATLGFISFYMALVAQKYYAVPIVYWFILNSLFLFDASITLVRRIINKEQWFAAHRKHAYQRLKQHGLKTQYILLGQGAINLLCFSLVLVLQKSVPIAFVLLILLSLFIMTYLVIEKAQPMYD